MTIIRKINVSQVGGNDANANNLDEIRPFGEAAFYLDTNQDQDKLTLMMFDGSRTHLKSKVLSQGVLFGSNADSSDGNGYDTIKLIPDAGLHYNDGSYSNDQYIIVDPTVPNHVHLRAGGTIDDSTSALIIGGENSNMEIQAGQNPPVYIRSNNNTWMFDTDGSLSVPGNILSTGHLGLDADYDAGYSVYIGSNHSTAGMLGGVVIGDTRGGFVDIITEKLLITNTVVPAHSTGTEGDLAGQVAFDNTHIYYCIANYNQLGHQVTGADYLGRTSVNTNGFQLSKTADTLQITVGDIISDSDGGGTSIVVSVTSDENYTYVGTGSNAYAAEFPLTFTSTDYVGGGNIWKRVAWSNDTW